MGKKIDDYHKLPNFERKQFPTFVKSTDEEKGIVEHFVAIMGNVDDGGDRIVAGAFAKSITERGLRVKCLDQHSMDSVTRIVGKPILLREVGRDELTPEVLAYAPGATGALLATTQYAIDTTRGMDVFRLVKGGYAPESSIGYDAVVSEYVKETGPDGKERVVRLLKEIRLWEYSNVVFGMNSATAVLSAKSGSASDGKPWRAVHEGDVWRVYKLDDDGNPTGEPLGEHDSEEDAQAQVDALYANADKAAHPPMNKAVNLQKLIESVWHAFYAQYPDIYDPDNRYRVVYYCREVWDEFVIVQQEGSAGNRLWKIAYTVGDGNTINFAPPQDWIEVTMVYVPLQPPVMARSAKPEGKAGRVLSRSNAERIMQAVASLQEALSSAGIHMPVDDDDDDDTEPKGADKQAGPGGAPPPTQMDERDRLLKTIDVELEELSMWRS